jgi:hypothetical protein
MTKTNMLEKLTTLRTVKLQPQHQAQFDVVFESLLNEMDTPSALSVVLIEQIAECLFWIKQHNKDKEELICYAMGEELARTMLFYQPEYSEKFAFTIRSMLERDDFEQTHPDQYAEFIDTMEKRDMTMDTLRAKALSSHMGKIANVDAVISRHIQNLRHLQKGLDAIDIKKRMLKRLDLELQQLTQQLAQQNDAIDHQS